MSASSARSVWDTLSKIDVNKHVKKKGKYSYLPWNQGWGYMMEHYPSATYNPLPYETHADGTVTAWSECTVEGITRKMYLPVMDNNNKAVQNPSARDINDTQQRCMTKCLALFGLGFYIYKGEGVPEPELEVVEAAQRVPEFGVALQYLFDAIGYSVKSRKITGSLADLRRAVKDIAANYSAETARKIGPFADQFEKRLTQEKSNAQAA